MIDQFYRTSGAGFFRAPSSQANFMPQLIKRDSSEDDGFSDDEAEEEEKVPQQRDDSF